MMVKLTQWVCVSIIKRVCVFEMGGSVSVHHPVMSLLTCHKVFTLSDQQGQFDKAREVVISTSYNYVKLSSKSNLYF